MAKGNERKGKRKKERKKGRRKKGIKKKRKEGKWEKEGKGNKDKLRRVQIWKRGGKQGIRDTYEGNREHWEKKGKIISEKWRGRCEL